MWVVGQVLAWVAGMLYSKLTPRQEFDLLKWSGWGGFVDGVCRFEPESQTSQGNCPPLPEAAYA